MKGRKRRPSAAEDIPSEDVLRMSIAKVDFGNSPDGDTLCLTVEELAIVQVCGRHVSGLVGKDGDRGIGGRVRGQQVYRGWVAEIGETHP